MEQVAPPRRRRWLPAVAALAVVALALAATALGSRSEGASPAPAGPAEGSWQPMAPSPLAARLSPTMAAWRDRVVVLGGDPYSRPCPPTASCVRELREAPRDAALYDVRADAWERLPDAPLPLDVRSSAVLGDALHLLLADGEHLSLDLARRAWERLPAPSGPYLRLVAAGDRLVAHPVEVAAGGPPDQAYDPSARAWAPLPRDPFGPSFDRTLVWAGEELVLVTPGAPPTQERTGPPYLKAAVLRDGRWQALPEQEVVIGGWLDWSWTGERVVCATTQRADGGEVDGFGRSIPSGGYLDPATGRWAELPAAPERSSFDGPVAAGGRWVANGEGLVLDTVRDRWVVLPPQPDAPDQDEAAVWAAGRLVVWGGARGTRPADPTTPVPAEVLASGAVWTPPAG